MNRDYCLIIGFIPEDWNENEDNDMTILCGDPETSCTNEIVFDFNFGCVSSTEVGYEYRYNKDFADENGESIFVSISAEASKHIAVQATGLNPIDLATAWEYFHGDDEALTARIVVVADDGSAEFENTDKQFNGCYYIRFFREVDEDILDEKVVVIRH